MAHMPHVALLIETSRGYGRGLLRGVARYVHEHRRWSIYFKPYGLEEFPPPWLKTWKGDGILARIDTPAMAQAVLRPGRPVVDLRGYVPGLGVPFIGVDNVSVAQLAL